ncbi:sppA [Symbiodinium microadriaticum]|nr:sppA [Symbiodinium microadriaticum]
MIGGGIIAGLASSAKDDKEPTIKEGSILHLKLNRPIKDRPSDNPFETFNFATLEDESPLSLSKIIENIEKASKDERIEGVYLDIQNLRANMSSTEAIRRALTKFKESGKFIVAYNEDYGQNEYYLCSVADEIYLNPAGGMTFKGLSAQLMFFKDALGRLDIDMQVIRHGKFKSAIEPFVRNDMSPENEAQLRKLIDGIWASQLEEISSARKIDKAELNRIADSLLIRTADDALAFGLVDDLLYEDEVKKLLKAKGEDMELVREIRRSKNKIAVIFAEGEIISGKSNDGSMGSETIADAIKKAREDKEVKAIVLRVNSPGGSALASDVIWRETMLAKAEKPLVVSMGDLAASGGYYISCGANRIYAEESTITGSIGVFGVIPNMQGMLNKKLGIYTDEVNTNANSDGLTPFRPLSNTERVAVKAMIEEIYDDFTSKVANGRGMSQADVDSIGQGRVWSGIDAIEIGLVDEIGGLEAAIASAAELAEVEKYKLKELPEQEDPMMKLMQQLANQSYLKIFNFPMVQNEWFNELINSAKDTEFGLEYGFADIKNRNHFKEQVFTGKTLMMGGSSQTIDPGNNTYHGDLSSIIMKNLPFWAEIMRTPDRDTALMDDFEAKLEKMAEICAKENVTSISGVPSWNLILLNKILDKHNKSDIKEIWPNLEVFFHGGVAFTPYKPQFEAIISGKMNYLETYNASEGFFGIEDPDHPGELILMLDYGIYYEFIPMSEWENEHPKTVGLEEVELDTNYALLISTNAGLWRYKIGDTEYTAAPVFLTNKEAGRHEWLIEFKKEPDNFEEFGVEMDNYLREINSDYDAKRKGNMALEFPLIHKMPKGSFYNWMKSRDKLGGQNKVPRLSNSREYLEAILRLNEVEVH